MKLIERFEAFYRDVSVNSLQQLSEIYSVDAVLADPLSKHEGLDAIKAYFESLLKNTQACECNIEHISEQGEHFFVTWKMTVVHPQLNSGRKFVVNGVSHLKSKADKMVFHQDYYDLGEMIYEQIPVLKHVIKSIKRRAV